LISRKLVGEVLVKGAGPILQLLAGVIVSFVEVASVTAADQRQKAQGGGQLPHQ
jgi:hypothetical protein